MPGGPPTITLVSPTEGPIDANTTIVLDVTDESDLVCVIVYVSYGDGLVEMIHDNVNFMPRFAASSTKEEIVDGYRFTLRRSGGWPSSPTIRVRAVDSEGNAS